MIKVTSKLRGADGFKEQDLTPATFIPPTNLIIQWASLMSLHAEPDRKSTFTGWTGACTGTDPCKVTMSSDVTTGAIFASESHLTVNPEAKTCGEVKINTTKFALFTVKDTGKKDIAVSSISIQGTDPDQFTIHSDRCTNVTLKANSTCTASVRLHRGCGEPTW
jgi:hypothetical protein